MNSLGSIRPLTGNPLVNTGVGTIRKRPGCFRPLTGNPLVNELTGQSYNQENL